MRALFMIAAAAVAAGCAPASDRGGDGAPELRAEPEAASFRIDGVVAVERVRTGEGAQTSVGAKFMRHSGLVPRGMGPSAKGAEAAERLVGSRLLLPASGECLSVTELEDVDATSLDRGDGASSPDVGEAYVELIDVGDVALVTDLPITSGVDDVLGLIGPEARQPYLVRLAPRAFPDVGELVSGVFYTSPDLAAPLPAPGQYAIEGTGAALTSSFELQAEAPSEPTDVAIDGRDLARGAVATALADVLVTWVPPEERAGADREADRIYIDVQAHDGQVHRCTFEDSGSAIVPGALVTAPSVAVAVHRLRETSSPLDAEAVDDEAGRVLVRFDLAVVGRIDVRRGPGG